MLVTVATLADRLGISKNTVRKWSSDYALYLTDSASVTGQDREYTEKDIQVFETIVHLRNQKIAHTRIAELLEEGYRVEGYRVEGFRPSAESEPKRTPKRRSRSRSPEPPDSAESGAPSSPDSAEDAPPEPRDSADSGSERARSTTSQERAIVQYEAIINPFLKRVGELETKVDVEQEKRIEAETRAARLAGELGITRRILGLAGIVIALMIIVLAVALILLR